MNILFWVTSLETVHRRPDIVCYLCRVADTGLSHLEWIDLLALFGEHVRNVQKSATHEPVKHAGHQDIAPSEEVI